MPLLDIPFVLCSDSPFQGMTAIPVFFWIAQFFSRTAIIPISIRAMIIRVHITRRTIVPIRIATDTHGSELPPFFQPHFHVSEACIPMCSLSWDVGIFICIFPQAPPCRPPCGSRRRYAWLASVSLRAVAPPLFRLQRLWKGCAPACSFKKTLSRTTIIPISIRARIMRAQKTRRTIAPRRSATDTHGTSDTLAEQHC